MSRRSNMHNGNPAAIDAECARIARILIGAAERLETVGDDDLDGALEAVADARRRLERVERELVERAREAGQSWAQIGAALNLIIPREPEPKAADPIRYARRRRSRAGAGARGGRQSR